MTVIASLSVFRLSGAKRLVATPVGELALHQHLLKRAVETPAPTNAQRVVRSYVGAPYGTILLNSWKSTVLVDSCAPHVE
jgi:hypothetical protein